MNVLPKHYIIKHNGKEHKFTHLLDMWNFCEKNGLPRPPRLKERDTHPYMGGFVKWVERQFWERDEKGFMKYSERAKEYYRNWLASLREVNNLPTIDSKLQ